MKWTLTGLIFDDPDEMVTTTEGTRMPLREARQSGLDWPETAHTMIGVKRLDALQSCIEDVLQTNVAGDFIETGVWRGGACIFMRAILAAYGVSDRKVWVADSFMGCPPPDTQRYPQDSGLDLYQYQELSVSRAEVEDNFRSYGLLDDQVEFLEGWFRDTLPTAPIERLAVMRLDGDLYESTIESLESLYPKLSVGGYVLIDDYGAIEACRLAVEDFRSAQGIDEPIQRIDWTGAFWQKS